MRDDLTGNSAHDKIAVDLDYASGIQHANGTLDLKANCTSCP